MTVCYLSKFNLSYNNFHKEINLYFKIIKSHAPMNIGIQTNRLEENRTYVGYNQLKQFTYTKLCKNKKNRYKMELE